MNTKKFSVLITTYNDSPDVESFIGSLSNQTIRPTFLVVVDGGSSDNTVQRIKEIAKRDEIELIIEYGNRLNIAQGYNKAIRICPTEDFFIMGIGNTYPSDFMEKMIVEQEKSGAQIVYSPIRGNEGTKFACVFNNAFVSYKTPMLGHDFGYASNRGVLINKSVFRITGLFYETFIYAGEDTEYFIRAQKKGIKSAYAEDTYLIWDTPTCFSQYLKKCKVNAIADIQCVSWKKIAANVISRLLLLIFAIIFIITGYYYLTLFLLFILTLLIYTKTKSLNWRILLLRLHFFFLPAYYYLQSLKKFKRSLIVYNKTIPQL